MHLSALRRALGARTTNLQAVFLVCVENDAGIENVKNRRGIHTTRHRFWPGFRPASCHEYPKPYLNPEEPTSLRTQYNIRKL